MGSFHEELVNARRDGTAPPQQDGEAERPAVPVPEVTYEPAPAQGAMSCRLCYAMVSPFRVAYHADWHRRGGV